MSSKGSVHFPIQAKGKVLGQLVEEYNKERSPIRHDKTHNRHGKPMIVLSKDWISIYDGYFGVYGDLPDGAYLTKILDVPALGIVNLNDDATGLMLMKDGKEVCSVLIEGDIWQDEVEVQEFMQVMELPYSEAEIEDLLSAEDNLELLKKFYRLTGCPYYMDYGRLSHPEEYLELLEETKEVNIYRKLKQIPWHED